MARSARASARKKNNQRLKSTVFGPVEQARAERLSKKLLELAQAPKPSDAAKMDVKETAEVDGTVDTTPETATRSRSNTAIKKARVAKKNRIEQRRVRKEKNKIAFSSHRTKSRSGKK